MATVFLSPIGNGFNFLSANGSLPNSGGKIATYLAGTSTPQATYTTSAGSITNANPIILDVAGRPTDGSNLVEIWLVAGIAYKLVLQDSTGAPIATYDNIVGINGLIGVTASDQASVIAGFAGGATMVNLLSSFTLTSTITIPQSSSLVGIGHVVITKGANVDMFDCSAIGATMKNLTILGAGASFTGRGIVISGGSDQVLEDIAMQDMNGYCIECTVGEAGQRLNAFRCQFARTNTNLFSIKLPDSGEVNGNRKFTSCTGIGGASFIDLAGSSSTKIIGCDWGINGVNFTSTTAKAHLVGNRIAQTVTLAIMGTSHIIEGNSMPQNATIDAACNNVTFHGNINLAGGTVVDNSTATGNNRNRIYGEAAAFTPVWGADTGSNTLGNGSLSGLYAREGWTITVTISLQWGSTTTGSAGNWFFNLPSPLNHILATNAIGSVRTLRAATAYHTGVCVSASGVAPQIYCFHDGDAAPFNNARPQAWGNGDTLDLTITYVMG